MSWKLAKNAVQERPGIGAALYESLLRCGVWGSDRILHSTPVWPEPVNQSG